MASPRRIALDFNAAAISAPRGRQWSASSINGNRARGTGILNNALYVGQMVWNRLSYTKDSDTGRRRSRQKAAGERIVKDLPDLRIVPQELWDLAKARQARLDHRDNDKPSETQPAPNPFWSQQRPRYLFSGLIRCDECGGGFSKISQLHFGCSTARNKGSTACINRLGIRRDVLNRDDFGLNRQRFPFRQESDSSHWPYLGR